MNLLFEVQELKRKVEALEARPCACSEPQVVSASAIEVEVTDEGVVVEKPKRGRKK